MNTLEVTEKSKTFEVLLVEDNLADIALVQEALREVDVNVNLSVAKDGVKAMEYLLKNGSYSDAPNPDLVILDINLPKKYGREVLNDMKNNASLKYVPVVVFTSSRSHKDVVKTYGLGAVCLITKPLGFYEFVESVKSTISNFLNRG